MQESTNLDNIPNKLFFKPDDEILALKDFKQNLAGIYLDQNKTLHQIDERSNESEDEELPCPGFEDLNSYMSQRAARHQDSISVSKKS